MVGLLGSAAAILTFWAWIWYLWDHKATAPGFAPDSGLFTAEENSHLAVSGLTVILAINSRSSSAGSVHLQNLPTLRSAR